VLAGCFLGNFHGVQKVHAKGHFVHGQVRRRNPTVTGKITGVKSVAARQRAKSVYICFRE
jgi:hypothetical protein